MSSIVNQQSPIASSPLLGSCLGDGHFQVAFRIAAAGDGFFRFASQDVKNLFVRALLLYQKAS